ncbi:hypothetical protein HPB48_025470 [Haemaphysalis longicornis]|uniref:Peptidase M13 N-terminal domain-containing protein n=1 Tax=Haemaphysalis longicornis TaxID=44386 RepID=A0A9J6H9W2_HAELO|nr:hypothetical protein HPB48_025470 [Haemaphysalis longicornis]
MPLLVAGACLLAAFALVVALVLLLPGQQRPPAHLCSTFECQEFGRLLSSSLDLSEDPCRNFTRFVCGGWERGNELSVREKYYEYALELITRKVRTVPANESEQNSVQRAAAVYRSCQAVLEGTSDQLREVKAALREANITWPQDPPGRDAVFTIMYCSLKLGWDAVLRVDTRFLEHKTSLLINPGRSFSYIMRRRQAANTTAFVRYFNELKNRFGDDDGGDYPGQLEYVEELEKLVQGTLFRAYDARTEEQVLTEGGFLGLGVNRWKQVFASLNPTRNKPLELLTTADDFVKTFLKFWDNKGEVGAHVFTSWCTVQVAALYANRDLVLNYYGSLSRARVYHSAFCTTKAYTFSRYALLERYQAERLSGKPRDAAEHVAQSVGDAFGRRLSQWRHLRGRSEAAPANRSSLSRAFHGFNRSHDRELIGYNMRDDSLVANWQKSTLLPSIAEDYIIVPAIESLELFALFFSEQVFQLMPVSVYFPFFDLGLTAAVNYGGIGAIVAAALGRLFLQGRLDDAADAKGVVACVHSGSDAVEAAALALSAGALLEAYRLDTEASFQPHPPELQRFNVTQIVLMALCFARCQGSELGNGAALCDTSLMHVKEFAEAFHCAPRTPMNPIRRCDLP